MSPLPHATSLACRPQQSEHGDVLTAWLSSSGASWFASSFLTSFDFDALPQEHLLAVWAVDGDGVPQIAEIQPALPDGATGYHRRRLRAPRDD